MNVNDLVDQLDDRYGSNWDLYRGAMTPKTWVVKLPDVSVSANALVAALIAAVDYVPLPRVPRPPKRYDSKSFEVCKNGSKWRLNYLGEDFGGQWDRKRDAIVFVARWCIKSHQEADVWENIFGWVHDKKEGVDFRWDGL